MMSFFMVPMSVTVQPASSKRCLAPAARPLVPVLFMTTSGTDLGSTGGASDERCAEPEEDEEPAGRGAAAVRAEVVGDVEVEGDRDVRSAAGAELSDAVGSCSASTATRATITPRTTRPAEANRSPREEFGATALEIDAEPAGRSLPLAGGAQAPQPLDQHRIGGERLRRVDEGVQHLVIAGRRHVEQLADGLFLGTGVLPPLPFEG